MDSLFFFEIIFLSSLLFPHLPHHPGNQFLRHPDNPILRPYPDDPALRPHPEVLYCFTEADIPSAVYLVSWVGCLYAMLTGTERIARS